MLTTTPRRELARPLAALFAALLASCTERDVPGTSETATTTDATTTDSPHTGTSHAEPTTDAPGTSSTSPSTTSVPGTSTTIDTNDPGECIYEDHVIVLTPEAYDAWLHGMGEVGTTGTTGTTGDTGTGTTSDSSTDTGTSTTGDTSTGTSTGDTGDTDTTGALEWSSELCNQICDALTSAEAWNIVSCDKTSVDADGTVTILCVEIVQNCDGRSHACITSRGTLAHADPVAAYLARAAHDEAASVYAFTTLAGELAAHGAPAELLARILAAAADELRHAEAVAGLVAARGGRCRPPQRRPIAARSLRELAIENASEGCVRETWAALLAAHQAEHAADPQLRAVMRGIAADEARHAELAWAIDAWLDTRVDADTRSEIAAARANMAAAVLASVAADSPANALVREAGVPGRARAMQLAAGLADALWAA
ncbi:MAG: ferritin-like domain-containing protein [Nannocystis sp.]|uniref:ferritin-like domain-containing protein n=1 Tax=Nannocystis sp. TaxID=1962667 RepID=UPI002427B214|nr:ferritin-like domain-containing protein [Nannocystis sp.]MBK9756578.1 ferritin-like domain-containing protein [Nannocystis sp.]